MKIYCAIVQYMFSEDVNDYTKVVYVGLDLNLAVQTIAFDLTVEDGWSLEASYIQVWEDGLHADTLNGYGKEYDWEN